MQIKLPHFHKIMEHCKIIITPRVLIKFFITDTIVKDEKYKIQYINTIKNN